MKTFLSLLTALSWLAVPYQSAAATSGKQGKPRCVIEEISDGITAINFLDALGGLRKTITVEDAVSHPEGPDGDEHYTSHEVMGCRAGDFAAVLTYSGVSMDEGINERGELAPSSKTLDFYSASGKMLWSKELRQCCLALREVIISRNDRRIWYPTYENGVEMVAIDEKGQEGRYKLPESTVVREHHITPNGRYGWCVVEHSDRRSEKYFFVDIQTGQIHEYRGLGGARVSVKGLVEIYEGAVQKIDGTYDPPGTLVHRYQFK